MLFELRASAADERAVSAFHQLCAPAGLDAAQLFDQAVVTQATGERYASLAAVFAADEPLARRLHDVATRVNAAMGGLYEGKLDHVRSTLCNPAFGVDDFGCCTACRASSRRRHPA